MNFQLFLRAMLKLQRFLSVSFLIASVLFLSACSQHQQIETYVQDYAERLESFTQIKIETPTNLQSLNAPIKADLAVEVEQITINLREFHAFNRCPLNQIIAERNTALGKMQLPSSRFIYEQKLLQEFSRCKMLLKNELAAAQTNTAKKDLHTLIAKLEDWESQKQTQLPAVWSNFVSQSNEIFLNLTLAQDFIAAAPNDNFQATRQAWQFIVNSYEASTLSSNELENHLKELENARLLARMWRTQNYISVHLDAISPVLTTYLQNNRCTTSKQNNDIEIMRNIFTLFFADKIQPLAAELNRYHYQLAPLLEKLIASGRLPHELTDYLNNQIVEGHSIYKNSMQNHITLWQQIFALCN